MKLKFKKIRLIRNGYGSHNEFKELNDEIIIDLSLHTVKEIINGEELNSLWDYKEITETSIQGIYRLSVSGYSNDWNFKLKGIKKLIVRYYQHKELIFSVIVGSIVSNAIFDIIKTLLTVIF